MPVYEEKTRVNGQKRYFIRTYVKDVNGNRKQITKHNKDWIGREGKKEAEWEEKRLQCSIVSYQKITLNELATEYLSFIENTVKLSTRKKISDNLRLHILPSLGDKDIAKLNTQDILTWHKQIQQNKFSNSYLKDIHGTLVTFLNYGCKFYNLEKNVASIVGNFKFTDSNKKKISYLTIDEFNHFIKQEKNVIYKCFFTILFFTGLRKGELWALKWENVDFQNKTLSTPCAYNPRNGAITTPKTAKSNRIIFISDVVLETLKEMEKYKTDEFVFGMRKITATTLDRKCKNNCRMANLNKNIRIHDFRHSFASLCINNNLPIHTISNYLGHENISTTLDIYSHLYLSSQYKLVEVLNEFS